MSGYNVLHPNSDNVSPPARCKSFFELLFSSSLSFALLWWLRPPRAVVAVVHYFNSFGYDVRVRLLLLHRSIISDSCGRKVNGLGKMFYFSYETKRSASSAAAAITRMAVFFTLLLKYRWFYKTKGWAAAGEGARAEEDEGRLHAPEVRPTRSGAI